MEDFSIILNAQGKKGRKKVDIDVVVEITDWIQHVDLFNIPSRGFEFTWPNQ